VRRYALFITSFAVALLCVRLGFWQLSRLRERRALNTSLRANLALPQVDLNELTPGLAQFRRVRGRGFFDYDHQIVVEARSFDGVPSVIVVTPLRLTGGRGVLVERGWVFSPDAMTVELDSLREADSATVDGVVIEQGPKIPPPNPDGWPKYVEWIDLPSLMPSFSYPLLPFVVRRTNVPPPRPGPRALRAVPVPQLSDGPHLSYAIQWFAFAIIAVVGASALGRKMRQEGGEKGEE